MPTLGTTPLGLTALLAILDSVRNGMRRKSETDIFERPASKPRTPAVVAQLRSLAQAQRKEMSTADQRLAGKIEDREEETEAQSAIQQENELERAHAEWIAAKNVAEA